MAHSSQKVKRVWSSLSSNETLSTVSPLYACFEATEAPHGIEAEYPVPECLIVTSSMKEDRALILPETLRAPHLHHLVLSGFAFPTDLGYFMSAFRLFTFFFASNIHPPIPDQLFCSDDFHPCPVGDSLYRLFVLCSGP